MTCRHQPGDTDCSSHPSNVASRQYEHESEQQRKRELDARTPDADKFEIVDVQDVGEHMVLKVKYPNCSKCSYEGNKVMVFLNINWKDVLMWKRIDPHFRQNAADHSTAHPKHAPGPAARFPASPEGWSDALAYARGKSGPKKS